MPTSALVFGIVRNTDKYIYIRMRAELIPHCSMHKGDLTLAEWRQIPTVRQFCRPLPAG